MTLSEGIAEMKTIVLFSDFRFKFANANLRRPDELY